MKSDSHDRRLDGYFSGELSEEDWEALEAELQVSGEAREAFWERAAMEQALESWGSEQRGDELKFPGHSDAREARRGGWKIWITGGAGWAAAAAVLIAWGWQSRGQEGMSREMADAVAPRPVLHSADGNPVATLTSSVDVEADVRFLRGQSIGAGQAIEIRRGLIELDFFSGARITLQGPATFIPDSDFQVTVLNGQAQAEVPESAVGFRMMLPDGMVTDFGRRFSVRVEGQSTTRVQALEGEIEVTTAKEGGSGVTRRLQQGQAVSLAGKQGLNPLEWLPMDLAGELESVRQRKDLSRLERWRESCVRIDADPSLITHFSLTPEERGTRVIRNHAGNGREPESGTVISAEWATGRWPGKPALAFRRPADRVRVDIPGRFLAASFVTWARVDGLPRRYNGLFLSEYGIDGEVHWQLSDDGRFLFGVRPPGSEPVSPFLRAFSDPVVTPWTYGSWRMLATTYDAGAGEVVHYVDGVEVGRNRLEETVALRFGRATLGNFFDPEPEAHVARPDLGEEWSFRNWTGLIDEFMLFSRVLDGSELRQLYEVGRAD
ncbi:ferric-dicitrate binding protein FerR (iron transport regulator) [Haloferula luteola]|uniref:Ferric-dicitrate binding protein FerR (Iron transport regulator) n=1 Tax=Haloferula luteola TaxID=595692 RepID=A0A840V5I2_9BACT|nr:LamG-like jellyroll fold domain-containing protein [Haloferula luteola]MBB5350048.1 ferric-dicitrate binding protein FerR (iron transport regulator) [Haloferula luteola]